VSALCGSRGCAATDRREAPRHRGSDRQARRNILTKLDLLPNDDTNGRVLAVLTYLRTGPSH
jgi:hypothetical protein